LPPTERGPMRKLFLVIPVAAIVIAGLVSYRLRRPPAPLLRTSAAATIRPAPLFQLYDEQSQIVRLARYVGRHRLLIVFFDGTSGPDRSELLRALREKFLPIHETGAIVLAISGLRPSELRPAPNERGERTARDEPFPFGMLADINDFEVHRRYGAFDDQTNKPREAVFVVDRTGIIRHTHLGPENLGAPELWADELRNIP
jgi:peroxiredoxin